MPNARIPHLLRIVDDVLRLLFYSVLLRYRNKVVKQTRSHILLGIFSERVLMRKIQRWMRGDGPKLRREGGFLLLLCDLDLYSCVIINDRLGHFFREIYLNEWRVVVDMLIRLFLLRSLLQIIHVDFPPIHWNRLSEDDWDRAFIALMLTMTSISNHLSFGRTVHSIFKGLTDQLRQSTPEILSDKSFL